MQKVNYKVSIEGKGPLWKPEVFLEKQGVPLKKKKSGKLWINEKVEINVSGELLILMNVRGPQNTGFDAVIRNLDRQKDTLNESDREIGDTGGQNNSVIHESKTP